MGLRRFIIGFRCRSSSFLLLYVSLDVNFFHIVIAMKPFRHNLLQHLFSFLTSSVTAHLYSRTFLLKTQGISFLLLQWR